MVVSYVMILCEPGSLRPSYIIDAMVQLAPSVKPWMTDTTIMTVWGGCYATANDVVEPDPALPNQARIYLKTSELDIASLASMFGSLGVAYDEATISNGRVSFSEGVPLPELPMVPFDIDFLGGNGSTLPGRPYGYVPTGFTVNTFSNLQISSSSGSVSAFWTEAKDLSITVEDLWLNYPTHMMESATAVLQYRELATRASNGYDLTIRGGSNLVTAGDLTAIVNMLGSGATIADITTDYPVAALVYATQLKDLIECSYKTPAQKTALLSDQCGALFDSLANGENLRALLSTYPELISANPLGFLALDRFAKTGIYPK